MKKIISLTVIIFLLAMSGYMIFEPEIVNAVDDSIVVTQVVSAEISISSPADVTMSSPIPGMTGNLGDPRTGSVTWTVKTNNAVGFNMSLAASTSPAMQLNATYTFSDYSPAVTGTPDYSWSSPASGEAEFGYTVEPATAADTVAKFRDNGTACAIGTLNTVDKCWYNFTTTTEQVINRTTETSSTGEAEVVKFRTESNAKHLKSGNYTATIIATALMN